MSFARLLQNALLTAVALALGLVAAEFALRWATRAGVTPALKTFGLYMANADRHYYIKDDPIFRRSADPDLGWEAIPGTYRDGMIRVNSAGFRGRERTQAKPSGTRRLAFLGDSETFGELLPEGQTLPAMLEAELARRGAPYEVLNFGIVGYNTEQEFALLRKKVIRYEPDIVLVYYVFNDPELPQRVLHFQGGGWLRDVYLYNLVLWITAARGPPPSVPFEGSFVQYYKRLHNSPYFDRVKTLIAEMGEYCAARNIRFVLVIAPEVIEVKDLGDGYPYGDIHAKLRALASANVQVIDPRGALAAALDGDDPHALWVTKYDPHKNARANAALAPAIADALLAPPARR